MLKQRPVMIVEDDPDIREVLQMILEGDGFKVITAKNGQEGLLLLQGRSGANLPFLILLDLQMPVMSGHEFLKYLRAHQQPELVSLPVIVLSAGKVDLGPLHVQDRLAKPVDVEKLIHMVQGYCDASESQGQQIG